MIELHYPWMLFLLPLPLAIWRWAPPYREQRQSLKVPFFQQLATLTGRVPSAEAKTLPRNWRQRSLATICWLLLVVALAKPQWLGEPIVRTESARDLMLMVDLSQSMEARDFTDERGDRINRLDAVKLVLDDFIDRREGDRIGLILFGNQAFLQVPFTPDREIARFLLSEAQVGMAGPQTMLGDAIGFSIQLFEKSDAKHRMAILLTDGNDTGSEVPPIQAADIAAENDIKLYTVAMGDPGTVGEQELDVDTLQDIASRTGGSFYQASDREGLAAIYRELDELESQEFEQRTFQPRRYLFHWPLAGFFMLAIGYHTAVSIRHLRARQGGNRVSI